MTWVNEWDRRLSYVDDTWWYFEDAPLDGYMYDLHDTGHMAYREVYIAGLQNGEYTYWDEAGNKLSEAINQPHGGYLKRAWHPNGQLAEETEGFPDGRVIRKRWDVDGIATLHPDSTWYNAERLD